MEALNEKYQEWVNFTETRERERERLSNPPGASELKDKIAEQQSVVLKAQAQLQMLKAQLVLLSNGDTPYRKADFDHTWGRKKTSLKAEVEQLMAEEIERGTSIPKIMKELNCRNPVWLYQVRDNLNAYRGASKEEMAQTDWHWSDVTSVHRYALGHDLEGSDWGFVLMHGAVDSEFEHEQCMFDFKTGNFITGNRQLFDSVTTGVKQQRSRMLAEILEGTYLKKVRRDTNPYFASE